MILGDLMLETDETKLHSDQEMILN